MLAKVAPPSNDFASLARYLLRGKPGTTPDPKRVAWTLSRNLPTDEPELAARYMAATAQLSPRTRKAAYHLMIAWHADERPSPQAMQTVALQTLDRAGLAEHQAIIMGHGDKPHAHLHILLNRVHPDTGRAWKTTHDFARLDRIMRDLSETHGFQYVAAHTFNPDLTETQEKQPNSRATYAAKRGAQTSRPQWSRRTAQDIGEDLSFELDDATSLDEIDAALASRGLRIEQKGQGYVVGDDTSYAKLSSLGLTCSARSLDLLKTAAKYPQRSIFEVDAVDITRAFVAIGLASKEDLAGAIDDVREQRHQMRASRTSWLARFLPAPQAPQWTSYPSARSLSMNPKERMPMTQPTQPRGNFVAFLNREKEASDRLPVFVNGRIAKPGEKEEFTFALWPFSYSNRKTGEVRTGFSGRMSMLPIGADAHQQIDAAANGRVEAPTIEGPGNLKLAPGAVLLFVSTPKPGSTTEKPKAYYGYANFGDGSPYVDVSVWAELDRYGKAMLSGNTQHPIEKHADEPTIETLIEEGRVSRGMPEVKKGRSSRG